MKVYIFSIGENTTHICCRLMRKYGFEVVLLDGLESMIDKYKRFIGQALSDGVQNCLKLDADIIPNKEMERIPGRLWIDPDMVMIQYSNYCLYRNGINVGNPVMYTRTALEEIAKCFNFLDPKRPEASAWRLPQINDYTKTDSLIVGLHGAYQDKREIERAKENKADRKQIDEYDFSVIEELTQTIF